jgi:hypothetical protein
MILWPTIRNVNGRWTTSTPLSGHLIDMCTMFFYHIYHILQFKSRFLDWATISAPIKHTEAIRCARKVKHNRVRQKQQARFLTEHERGGEYARRAPRRTRRTWSRGRPWRRLWHMMHVDASGGGGSSAVCNWYLMTWFSPSVTEP